MNIQMLWYTFRDIPHIRLYEYLHLVKDFPLEISRILFRTTLKLSDLSVFNLTCYFWIIEFIEL